MTDINKMFQPNSSDDPIVVAMAEGYVAGTETAQRITKAALDDMVGKSREFKQGFFMALQENIG